MARIQDFILEQPESEIEETAALPQKKKSAVSYEIAAKTNTDVVIKRKTAKTERFLAIIPSKGQYYISEDGNAGDLTVADMVKFLASLDEPIKVDLDWINEIEKGKAFAEGMIPFLDRYREEICAGIITPKDFAEATKKYGYRPNDLITIFRENRKLAVFLKDRKGQVERRPEIKSRHSYQWFQPFACGAFEENDALLYLVPFSMIFGIDKTRLYVDKMLARDVNFQCSLYYFMDLINVFYQINVDTRSGPGLWTVEGKTQLESLSKQRNIEHLDADAFIDYCCAYQSEGYSSLSNFFIQLKDDWYMQRDLYGKIRVKYPKNLATHHDKLTFACSMLSSEIDENKIARRYGVLKENEWSNHEYVILAPQTVGDIVDEATQQANCLRTYLDRVADGLTDIYFLRNKKTPDESLVTVEVNGGTLVQVKGKFNREPSFNQKKVLSDWAKDKGFHYAWQGGAL